MLTKIMNTDDFDVVSIRPWTMSSLVASNYTDGNSGVLMGDAALVSLKEGTNLHSLHVTSNLRSILQQGRGLPSLFPEYELGFGYKPASDPSTSGSKSDILGYEARVQVGHLLPHIDVKVFSDTSRYPNLQWTVPNQITTSDLPSQMRVSEPCFVLLLVEWEGDMSQLEEEAEGLFQSFGLKVKFAQFVKEPIESEHLILLDESGTLCSMTSGLVLIRLDGHVSCIAQGCDQLRRFFLK
jgi:hypothetical protein